MIKYINRYNNEYTFEAIDESSIMWKGPFGSCKFAQDDKREFTYINPQGGPFIGKGTHMAFISEEFAALEVRDIIWKEEGVILECFKHNNSDIDIHKEYKIIGGIIHTEA